LQPDGSDPPTELSHDPTLDDARPEGDSVSPRPGLHADLESQRHTLALLYQLTLRCLSAESPAEVERLLLGALRRLLPLASAGIVYRAGGKWRCGTTSHNALPDALVRAVSSGRRSLADPVTITAPEKLRALGLPPGSATILPLRRSGAALGAVCVVRRDSSPLDPETRDVVQQLGTIASAALYTGQRAVRVAV
jgi:hypothetical protein